VFVLPLCLFYFIFCFYYQMSFFYCFIARGGTPGRAGLAKGRVIVSTHPLASPSEEGENNNNTPKGRALVSASVLPRTRPCVREYQYPEGSSARFYNTIKGQSFMTDPGVSIPRRVGGVFPLPAIDYFNSHSVFIAKYQ